MITTWLVIALLQSPTSPMPETILFNGKDLDGWIAEGVSQFTSEGTTHPVWSAKDGILICKGRGFGFLRYQRREFADFRLHLEFRMSPRCNSGIGIRTGPFDPARSRATRPSFYSYEIQLIDDVGKPPTTHSSGSLYRYVAPRANAMRPAGEWNALDVECDGPIIKVTLNGKLIIDQDQRAIEPLRKKPLQGHVSLQNHGGDIQFRSVRIRDFGVRVTNSHP